MSGLAVLAMFPHCSPLAAVLRPALLWPRQDATDWGLRHSHGSHDASKALLLQDGHLFAVCGVRVSSPSCWGGMTGARVAYPPPPAVLC